MLENIPGVGKQYAPYYCCINICMNDLNTESSINLIEFSNFSVPQNRTFSTPKVLKIQAQWKQIWVQYSLFHQTLVFKLSQINNESKRTRSIVHSCCSILISTWVDQEVVDRWHNFWGRSRLQSWLLLHPHLFWWAWFFLSLFWMATSCACFSNSEALEGAWSFDKTTEEGRLQRQSGDQIAVSTLSPLLYKLTRRSPLEILY